MTASGMNFFNFALAAGALLCLVELGAGTPRKYLLTTKDKHQSHMDYGYTAGGADYASHTIDEGKDAKTSAIPLPPRTAAMKAFVDVMRGIDGGATMKLLKEGVEKKDIQILKQAKDSIKDVLDTMPKKEKLALKNKIIDAASQAKEEENEAEVGNDYTNDAEEEAVNGEEKLYEWLKELQDSVMSKSMNKEGIEEMIQNIKDDADKYFDEFGLSEQYRASLLEAIDEVEADNLKGVLEGAIKIVSGDNV